MTFILLILLVIVFYWVIWYSCKKTIKEPMYFDKNLGKLTPDLVNTEVIDNTQDKTGIDICLERKSKDDGYCVEYGITGVAQYFPLI